MWKRDIHTSGQKEVNSSGVFDLMEKHKSITAVSVHADYIFTQTTLASLAQTCTQAATTPGCVHVYRQGVMLPYQFVPVFSERYTGHLLWMSRVRSFVPS